MTLEEIEGEARRMLVDDSAAPKVLELARRLLGGRDRVLTVPPTALPGDGALVKVHGQVRIYVRSQLPVERLRWVVAHELGHLALGLDSSSQANEDACDAFAAALLAPKRAFAEALRKTGPSYTKLATWFLTSESCVALRIGEVTRVPVALIAPERVRVRGADFEWPGELRAAHLPGIRRSTLRDDRRRVALRAG